MRKIINLIINLFKKDIIVCPCGYKTTSQKKAHHHLMTQHRAGVGSLDFNSELVIW